MFRNICASGILMDVFLVDIYFLNILITILDFYMTRKQRCEAILFKTNLVKLTNNLNNLTFIPFYSSSLCLCLSGTVLLFIGVPISYTQGRPGIHIFMVCRPNFKTATQVEQ